MSYGQEDTIRTTKNVVTIIRWRTLDERNIEAFVELIGSDKLNVERLITHRFPIENAESAYQLISGNVASRTPG
jgi:threonine dehydrogenase-like Zn-dependent dehydrogenase